jgi:hypothetical protein
MVLHDVMNDAMVCQCTQIQSFSTSNFSSYRTYKMSDDEAPLVPPPDFQAALNSSSGRTLQLEPNPQTHPTLVTGRTCDCPISATTI